MRQPRARAPHREKGFTLIELLIIIVILGVLAAVVILALGAFDQRGERAACESDVKAVEVAVEAFRANEGRYPQDLTELTQQPGNYLRELPNTTPSTGQYWIGYDNADGKVGGFLEGGAFCAGGLLAMPSPSDSTGGPGGGGEPGGGGSSTTTSTSSTTSPSGGSSTSSSSTPPGGVAQPPGFPAVVQPEDFVEPFFQDTQCGDLGEFIGSGSGTLPEVIQTITIPNGFAGQYRVTVNIDSAKPSAVVRISYRNSGAASWATAEDWTVLQGCNRERAVTINLTTGTKHIRVSSSSNGEGLLLDWFRIERVS